MFLLLRMPQPKNAAHITGASCRGGLSFPKITRESRRRDRRQRLVVEYAPKCQFDLVSFGHPLDPILDGRGPALRAIDHQPPEVSLAGSSGGAATNRLSVQAVHFFVVGRGHEMRERKGRPLISMSSGCIAVLPGQETTRGDAPYSAAARAIAITS